MAMITPPHDQPEFASDQQMVHGQTRSGESALRWVLIGMLMLMVVGLSFGLGFGVRHVTMGKPAGTAAIAASTREDGSPDFRVMDDIWQALRENYIDPDNLQSDLLRSGAINGLLTAVGDTHQTYVSKEQANLDDLDLRGQFEGIGASVDLKAGEIVIVNPFTDSPAKAAGVRAGDVILEIDGKSTKGLNERDAVKLIRGKKGTTVTLKLRHTDGKTEDITITRDAIKIASVKPDRIVDRAGNVIDDVGYVRIEQFTARTADELNDYLKSIQGKPLKGLVLDLRNNPGGLLKSVEDVASQFMKNQTILIEQYRGGRENTYKSGDKGIMTDPSMKLVVLVNHNSASASEILAGSIRDNKRGIVMGETTFGKGTVNRFIELPTDGGRLYVTIGRWLTPKRDQIEGRGVKPDVEVRAGENESPQDYNNSVLHSAVEYLRNGG